MKIKTSELTGAALDWAVAKCEGNTLTFFDDYFRRTGVASGKSEARVDSMLEFQPLRGKWARLNSIGSCTEIYKYSTDWSQGGPIIEREEIDLFSIANGNGWCAQSGVRVFNGYGTTPLIAAMRCYVASKLGDEVEVPDELI